MMKMHTFKHSQKKSLTGPEAQDIQEHVLVIYKALNCTRPAGACWYDKVSDILQPMHFLQPPLF